MLGKQGKIEALIFDKDPEIILEKDYYHYVKTGEVQKKYFPLY